MASRSHLIAGRLKGGPAGGRPLASNFPTVLKGAEVVDAAAMRRRMIRQKLAEAAGLVKPGEVFRAYGPHKTAGADQILKGGSGFGRELGKARRG